MTSNAEALQNQYEPHPDPQRATGHVDPSKNSSTGVDYEPHPESSLKLSPEHENIIKCITRLYSGSASKEDMEIYAPEAIYDGEYFSLYSFLLRNQVRLGNTR